MSNLIEPITHQKNPVPGEHEELLADDSGKFKQAKKLDPKSVQIQILYRPGEAIHDLTYNSSFTWLDMGTKFTKFKDPFGGWINTTRNWQSRTFLKTTCKYLCLIDADVGVDWFVPYSLAERNLPVVSAVVPCFTLDHGLMLNIAVKDPSGTARFPTLNETGNIPKEGLLECSNVGTGCVVIRRDVIERLWDMFEEDNDFGQPFELPIEEQRRGGMTGAVPRGEDICFSDRARKAGFKCYVDFGIHALHNKKMTLRWPEEAVADVSVEDWAVSVFDKKVVPV